MRKSQWYTFAILSFGISLYFWSWYMTTGGPYRSETGILLNRAYSAAYLLSFCFSIACWICGHLEGRAIEKEEETRCRESIMVAQVAEKIGLKGKPKNRDDLFDLAEAQDKFGELLIEIPKWYEEDREFRKHYSGIRGWLRTRKLFKDFEKMSNEEKK